MYLLLWIKTTLWIHFNYILVCYFARSEMWLNHKSLTWKFLSMLCMFCVHYGYSFDINELWSRCKKCGSWYENVFILWWTQTQFPTGGLWWVFNIKTFFQAFTKRLSFNRSPRNWTFDMEIQTENCNKIRYSCKIEIELRLRYLQSEISCTICLLFNSYQEQTERSDYNSTNGRAKTSIFRLHFWSTLMVYTNGLH